MSNSAGCAILASTGLVALYAGLTAWLIKHGSPVTWTFFVSQVVSYSFTAGAALYAMRHLALREPDTRYYAQNWPKVLSVTCALVAVAIRFMVKQPPSSWSHDRSQDWLLIAEAYVVGRLLVPCAEELVFRGLLFKILRSQTILGPIPIVGITATVFAALHWPPLYGLSAVGGATEVLSAFAAAIAFGGLRAWTGSVLPGLGLHMIGNTVGF